MKILLADLKNPSYSFYFENQQSIGTWLWGRPLSQYAIFLISEDLEIMYRVELKDPEVQKIQKHVDREVRKFLEFEKLKEHFSKGVFLQNPFDEA
jgi:hypothetical protein